MANQLALQDRQLQQQNFDKYGNQLLKDIALKEDVFNRQLEQAKANKEMGMGLASDAIYNMRERANFDKFYGPNSTYEKLRQSMVDKGMNEAEIAKSIAEYYKNPEWIKGVAMTPITPVTSSTTVYQPPKSNKTEVSTTTTYNLPTQYQSAIKEVVGDDNRKNLTKTEWFDLLDKLRDDGQGGKRLTTEIYDELAKAGYNPPKGIH